MKKMDCLLTRCKSFLVICVLSVSISTFVSCAENSNQNSGADTGSSTVTASPEMGADTLSNRHLDTTSTDTSKMK